VIEELHLLDSSTEGKTFGPGYGEFLTGGGGNVEALALAVPTDALRSRRRCELVTLESGAADVFDAAQSRNWKTAQATVERMTAARAVVRAGGSAEQARAADERRPRGARRQGRRPPGA
jgi:hypothetical protein